MPEINNINNLRVLDSKKIASKLSFEIGEVFQAKVVNTMKQGNEILLKMLDGWQFTAVTKNPIDVSQQGLLKFKVVGFEQGKLSVVIVPKDVKEDREETSIDTILKQENLSDSKEDRKIFKAMIKHDMSLTKENMSLIKSIMDFKERASSNPEEEDIFIEKYLQSKGIEKNSNKGSDINKTLKSFFTQLNKASIDEILTLKENGLDLTEANFKSLNKIFKGDKAIYKGIIESIPNNSKVIEVNKEIVSSLNPNNIDEVKVVNNAVKEEKSLLDIIKNENNNSIISNTDKGKDRSVQLKIIQSFLDTDIQLSKENISSIKMIIDLKEKILVSEEKTEVIINSFLKENNISPDSESGIELAKNIKEFFQAVKEQPINDALNLINKDNDIKEKLPIIKQLITDILKQDDIENKNTKSVENRLSDNIKNEITEKTEFMKDVIKSIKQGDWALLKNNINDIKVFNSVSNQYYFMDLPLNINQNEYECKLLIKDERKQGKKIDSKNVKMVVSVKTLNMGEVDAYINVKDRNIVIDLKCKHSFVKVLEGENEKLYKTLQELNYNATIRVEDKIEEANLMNTRAFFRDDSIGTINTLV